MKCQSHPSKNAMRNFRNDDANTESYDDVGDHDGSHRGAQSNDQKETNVISVKFIQEEKTATMLPLHCERCRRVLEEKRPNVGTRGNRSSICPFISRLRQYQLVANNKGTPFLLRDFEAIEIMKQDCSICGKNRKHGEVHGITRLKIIKALQHTSCSTPSSSSSSNKDMMGPYTKDNTAAACRKCNLMKTFNSKEIFIMMCRHIATTTTWKAATTRTGGKPIKSHEGGVVVVQRGGGGGVKYEHSRVNRHRCNDDDIDGQRHSADDDDGPFGLFPECFRNNTSKRTRSSYITTSKTHSLTHKQFEEIVRNPCHYCGKKHRPPIHYNGLDRLDSTKRVYTQSSCVSCCGTCNIMKGRFTEEEFLDHCLRVAIFNTR